MTVKDCVKTMLSKRGWSQRKLAEKLGYSGQGSIGKTLLRNDGMGMTVESVQRLWTLHQIQDDC